MKIDRNMALDVLKSLKQVKMSQKPKHLCLKFNDRSLVSLKICLGVKLGSANLNSDLAIQKFGEKFMACDLSDHH